MIIDKDIPNRGYPYQLWNIGLTKAQWINTGEVKQKHKKMGDWLTRLLAFRAMILYTFPRCGHRRHGYLI